ncbi:MAG: BrnT family toxin [Patescibacteria group bacterium]
MDKIIISEPIEFEWDKGNVEKNFKKHGIENREAEEIFLNEPLISEDKEHSKTEKRYQCLGVTDKNKKLFISFTVRKGKIRIISVRRMDKKETNKYEQET